MKALRNIAQFLFVEIWVLLSRRVYLSSRNSAVLKMVVKTWRDCSPEDNRDAKYAAQILLKRSKGNKNLNLFLLEYHESLLWWLQRCMLVTNLLELSKIEPLTLDELLACIRWTSWNDGIIQRDLIEYILKRQSHVKDQLILTDDGLAELVRFTVSMVDRTNFARQLVMRFNGKPVPLQILQLLENRTPWMFWELKEYGYKADLSFVGVG